MTAYYTEFDGYTVDAQPSDWTVRWGATNSSWAVKSDSAAGASRRLEHTSSADGHRLLSWDSIDADANRANVEVLARVQVHNITGGAAHQVTLVARGSGSSGSENAYLLSFASSSTGGLRLRKLVSGTVTNLGTEHVGTIVFAADKWYWMRFRVNGTTLQGKIWEDGDAEPADWQVSATDSSISAAGWVGVGNFESTGTTRDFDYVSIGTNGDAAPLHSLSTTGTKVHLETAEVAYVPVAKAVTYQDVLEVAVGAVVPGHIHQAVLEVMYLPAAPSADAQQPRPMIIC